MVCNCPNKEEKKVSRALSMLQTLMSLLQKIVRFFYAGGSAIKAIICNMWIKRKNALIKGFGGGCHFLYKHLRAIRITEHVPHPIITSAFFFIMNLNIFLKAENSKMDQNKMINISTSLKKY